jgi:hypothetical protein
VYGVSNDFVETDERVLMSIENQPAIHQVASPSSLNTSLKIWYETVLSDSPKTKEALSETNSWVDVRDAALCHVLALEKDAAGGQRIITASGALHVNLIYPVILTLI